MNEALTGKIFHFKPGRGSFVEGNPNRSPDSDQKGTGGRRSNRLFALHPVVVIKDLKPGDWDPGGQLDEDNENVRTRGHSNDPEPARDDYLRWHGSSRVDGPHSTSTALPTPTSSPTSAPSSSSASSPTSPSSSGSASKRELHNEARRPSLERRDAEHSFEKRVVIVNITSQRHDAIEPRNYLPIAAPRRKYSDELQKRVFLTPIDESSSSSASSSPDAERDTDMDTFSEGSFSTDPTDYGTDEPDSERQSNYSDEKYPWWREPGEAEAYSEAGPSKREPAGESYTERPFLSNNPEVPPLNNQPSASDDLPNKSSDEMWKEQVGAIKHLTPDDTAMPRHDSFVRLDSRTTVAAKDLHPFRRKCGNQYALQPQSQDLLWQAVLECERGYRRPEEAVLYQIQKETEEQIGKAMTGQAARELRNLQQDALGRINQQIKWPRDQQFVERVLEEQVDRAIEVLADIRSKESLCLKDTYKSLHCEMVLAPIEKEKPFHPEQYLGKMIQQSHEEVDKGRGEGEASLNKPIKSALALKAMAAGLPLPDKREEARAHRQLIAARPCRANSNPEDVKPHDAVPAPPTVSHHPLASKHSQSSGAIAAQSQRPKATLHNQTLAKPRIPDKNLDRDWRKPPAPAPKPAPKAASPNRTRTSVAGAPKPRVLDPASVPPEPVLERSTPVPVPAPQAPTIRRTPSKSVPKSTPAAEAIKSTPSTSAPASAIPRGETNRRRNVNANLPSKAAVAEPIPEPAPQALLFKGTPSKPSTPSPTSAAPPQPSRRKPSPPPLPIPTSRKRADSGYAAKPRPHAYQRNSPPIW